MNSFSPRLRRSAAAVLAAVAFLAAPAVLAADVVDIGYVAQDQLASLPAFQAANRQLQAYQNGLARQFQGRAKSARSQADQQKLQAEFQQKMADKQRQLLGPLFGKAQVAIASVASSKNLSVVVDRQIVVYGGTDITKNVADLLGGVGDPVPPVNTPPPSSVGYVDQSQIDALPSVKAAQADVTKFGNDQLTATRAKLKSAKTDKDRNDIVKAYQKTISDKQDSTVKPLVEKTRDAIAVVAKKKNLILVVDKRNIVFGGMDITADVTSALK